MKNKCAKNQMNLSRWVDGELKAEEGQRLAVHIEDCAFCREEVKSLRTLNEALQSFSKENIEVSPGFETVFWKKISDWEESPWFEKLLNGLEAWVPKPNFRQAVAFSLLAFFIGNIGGFGWELRQGAFAATSPASIRHFSGLQEFKGISSTSLAATYLTAVQIEGSK